MFIHAVHLWVVNDPLVRFNVQVCLGVWQGYGYSWVLDSIAKQREVIIFRLVSLVEGSLANQREVIIIQAVNLISVKQNLILNVTELRN